MNEDELRAQIEVLACCVETLALATGQDETLRSALVKLTLVSPATAPLADAIRMRLEKARPGVVSMIPTQFI